MEATPFWKSKSLAEMTQQEWESVCDRCGKCCVLKVEDMDSGDDHYTDIACKLLDCATATCMNYADRKTHVPDCVTLTPDNLSSLQWMPTSCAYRRLDEGHDLPSWHPLVSGKAGSTSAAGQSVAGRVFPEGAVEAGDIIDHIVEW